MCGAESIPAALPSCSRCPLASKCRLTSLAWEGHASLNYQLKRQRPLSWPASKCPHQCQSGTRYLTHARGFSADRCGPGSGKPNSRAFGCKIALQSAPGSRPVGGRYVQRTPQPQERLERQYGSHDWMSKEA